MSQPRHQPRNTPDVKLRLRLPTDGSVDLDKLRTVLEAQLKTSTASAVAEPVEVEEPKVLPELEVLPQHEPAREPNAAWVWIRQNTPTTVALVSAVAAFVFAVTWGMQRVGGGEAHSLVKWGFILAALSLLGAFGTVLVRKLRETAANDGETLADPLVEPEPEGSFQFGVWLSQNAPTYVAAFTFALAFVTGIIWVTLKSTGEGNISSSLYWVIGINMALFLVSMGFVLIRQLKIADSAASHVWTNVKADPKKLTCQHWVLLEWWCWFFSGSLLSKILRVLTGPKANRSPRLNRAIPKISPRETPMVFPCRHPFRLQKRQPRKRSPNLRGTRPKAHWAG